MDHNQAMELVVTVLGTAPLEGNRLGAHKLTFQLTFTHSKRVSCLLVLAGRNNGSERRATAQQWKNVGTGGFPRDRFARPCVRRAVSPVDLESASRQL